MSILIGYNYTAGMDIKEGQALAKRRSGTGWQPLPTVALKL